MNTSLRKRLVAKYGEIKVKQMELSFKPPKVHRYRIKYQDVQSYRVSPDVIRRRKKS